jgi:hypothetical protein
MSKVRASKRAASPPRAKKAANKAVKKTTKKASKSSARIRSTMKRPSKRAASKRKPEAPMEIPVNFAAVAAVFAKDRLVSLERGWGADNVALKLDGKTFVMFVRGHLVAKLPKSRVNELVDAGQGIRFDPRRNGRLMKEWLVVASSAPNWVELAREAHGFVKMGKV